MEAQESKRLVMFGIHRKGQKGFKTTIRKDAVRREKAASPLNPDVRPLSGLERDSQRVH